MMAGVSLIFIVLFFYFSFRKELKASEKHDEAVTYPSPQEAIADRKRFAVSVGIFAAAIVMLVTHAQTGLTVATIGVFIGAFSLLASGGEALSMIKKLGYKTLLFFIGLFVVVGGMEQTGVLNSLAGIIDAASGNNVKWVVAIVLWLSALASAFVDNIPFAATMIPVIRSLAQAGGMDLSVLAWALSMGTDIGGCGTPIGASANVVGISVAAKNGHFYRLGEILPVCSSGDGAGNSDFHGLYICEILLRGLLYGGEEKQSDHLGQQTVWQRRTQDSGSAGRAF